MNADGKRVVQRVIDQLDADGNTNLWDGLHSGLEVLRTDKEKSTRFSTILLLTDGEPTVIPKDGHTSALQSYRDQFPFSCSINTFGFGYSLDSKLLTDLAVLGGGSFAFIPDASFVGTVFIHAVSNLLVTMGKNAELSLEPLNGAKIETVLGGHQKDEASWGVRLNIGSIQLGQSKNVVVNMSDMPTPGTPYISATLTYQNRKSEVIKVAVEGAERIDFSMETEVQRLRLVATDRITQALTIALEGNLPHATEIISALVAEMKASRAAEEPRIVALLKDVEGQVCEALSKPDFFKRWGCHYLRSLTRAHLLQQCNNFKDPGVQVYGSELFTKLKDMADEKFLTLPPPRGSLPNYDDFGKVRPAPVVSMARYHYSGGGCVKGSCLVSMADGTLKAAESIRKGDLVMSAYGCSDSRVSCVVKTIVHDGQLPMVELPGGLTVTPYHPIFLQERGWCFPCEAAVPKMVACDAIYTFVLSSGHVLTINGVQYVSLGHEFTGDKREHAFFGSSKCIDALRSLTGFNDGCVVLDNTSFIRDVKTGLVIGFKEPEGFSA